VKRLLDDPALERSSVVANCTMNRERSLTGSNGYGRELGIDVVDELSRQDGARWLDLCCGTGRALYEAAAQIENVEIVGVDLAGHFVPAPPPQGLTLVVASVSGWEPEGRFELITSVHGLHYVGDKLGFLTRAASWLSDDGLLVANFDVRSVRWGDGTAMGRRLTAELRRQGFTCDTARRRISLRGRREIRLPYRYLGADDTAGPNYTGQPAVDSFYDR
jgi:SAM-dependent methyltransferase